MPFSIGSILTLAFKPYLDARTSSYHWASKSLRCKEAHGLVKVMSLGTMVDTPIIDQFGHIQSRSYPVDEIAVTVSWSEQDEVINDTENKKVSLVKRLLDNAINHHDQLILKKMGRQYKAIASKQYRYMLGPIHSHYNNQAHVVKLYSAVAFVHRDYTS
jgi:hypothetical protein